MATRKLVDRLMDAETWGDEARDSVKIALDALIQATKELHRSTGVLEERDAEAFAIMTELRALITRIHAYRQPFFEQRVAITHPGRTHVED